jgi:hypothetical protein
MDPIKTAADALETNPTTINIVDDHEVSMAAAQVYRAAKCAMEIHRMLKMVNGLEGWMQAKITLAADYLESVSSNLEYDLVAATMMESTAPQTVKEEEEDSKHKRIAALGRKIMDLAQESRPKTDQEMDLMNKLSAVGEKMTMIGTPFGPKGLTSKEKELVQQAQDMIKKKDSDLEEALFPQTRADLAAMAGAVKKAVSPDPAVKQGNLVRELMAAGFSRFDAGEIALKLIKTGVMPDIKGPVGKFLSDPHDREQAQRDWVTLLMKKGMSRMEAGDLASKLAPKGFAPKLPFFEDRQKYLPGVPGEIISSSGNYVLIHDKDIDDDVIKNEYEVYTMDGERVTNLDMPYAKRGEAIHRFRSEYGS